MQEPRHNPTTQMTQTGQTDLISVVNLVIGQSHHAALRRGSVISVASGAVLVISRIRLEDTVLTVQVQLHPGGVYCVAVSGTFEIRALKEACLRQVVPVLQARRWLQGGLNGWLSGRLPGRLHLQRLAPGLLNNVART